jgi:hypothetical protein
MFLAGGIAKSSEANVQEFEPNAWSLWMLRESEKT